MASEPKTRRVFDGKVIVVDHEQVRLPNGSACEMEVVRHPGGAAVVALDREGQVCLLRQYRYVVSDWIWELPAGRREAEEAPLVTAQRELREEAGIEARQWEGLGSMWSSPGVFTEEVHLYLAQDLCPCPAAPDAHEVFDIHWLSFSEVLTWALEGRIRDAKTVIALYRAREALSPSG